MKTILDPDKKYLEKIKELKIEIKLLEEELQFYKELKKKEIDRLIQRNESLFMRV